MSLEKLEFDKFSHDASLTGDGSKNNPLGINVNGITGLQPYNERLLFSAELSGVSSVELPTSKNHFERLRFVLGARNWKENGLESKEFGTETTAIHLNFMNGAGGNAYWVGTYGTWSDDRHLTVQKSKNIYGSYSNANITGNISWTADDVNCIKEIYGVNEEPRYFFFPLSSEGGSVSSNINPGYSGDIATITVTPESDVWRQSALNITGAELTGNDFMFGNSNVTAQAEFEHSKDLTLVPNEHATLSADKLTGFSGDIVTVDATTDEGWYFTGLNVTGATATGNQFMFVGNDVTAEGLYTDEGYPITYIVETGGTLTGDTDLYIPGSDGVQLSTSYNTYYRFSGYQVTGGYIENGKLYPTAACTAKAVYKVNAFTATGIFDWTGEKSSSKYNYANFSTNVNGILKAFTGSKPSNWPATNGAWNVTNASAYGISAKAAVSGYFGGYPSNATARIGISIGGTMKTSAQWVKKSTGQYTATCTATLNKNTTQGQIRCSGQANAGTSAATYKAKLTTNTWSATGYAP